jgi:Domain of unknown function (DUF397)
MKPTTDALPVLPGTAAGPRREAVHMADLSQAEWRKSTYSANNGCVEVAFVDDDGVAVRDSKDRSGPVLLFRSHEWATFVRGVRAGEFDQFLTLHD